MARSEIDPKAIKIDKLLNHMEDGSIKLPAFQRGFVWKQSQVLDLLDSIFKDYPIGTILLWDSYEKLRATRNIGGFLIPERDPKLPVRYVLDGQQRLTAIYALFCRDRRLDESFDKYRIDPAVFDISFDLDEKVFLPNEELKPSNRNLKLSALFNSMEFHGLTTGFAQEHIQAAVGLQSQFQNYEVPVVVTSKTGREDIGIIFERINNTATKLSTLDLMVAWTWSDDFHLREQLDDILEALDQKGFGDTDEKIILQCLSAIIKKTTRTKDILSLDPKEVKDNIDLLRASLEKAIDLLSTELHVASSDLLPQSHQIIPFTYFFSRVQKPSAPQNKALKNWFWRTSFSLRYQGATDIRLNQDILFFDGVIKGDFEGLDKYSPTLSEIALTMPVFSKTNVYTRSLLLLLAQMKPLDLINGRKIDLGKALSKFNRKEYHHVFPQAYLRDNNIAEAKINSICNFCFLPADSNKRISNRSPSDYVFNVIPAEHFDEILESNLMPRKKAIYKKNDYEAFLNERARLILDVLGKLMG
jgi:hypothetical protein